VEVGWGIARKVHRKSRKGSVKKRTEPNLQERSGEEKKKTGKIKPNDFTDKWDINRKRKKQYKKRPALAILGGKGPNKKKEP